MQEKMKSNQNELLYRAANIVFFLMAIVVIWHSCAPEDYRVLTEIGKKIWAMAGLSLYLVILLERHRRRKEKE